MMKTYFYILLIVITLISSTFICTGQTVFLYTPNGTKVYAFVLEEMSQSDITYFTNKYRNEFPYAEVLANASSKYNCHSYAWNLTDYGSQICWLNQWNDDWSENLSKYWTDGSYVQTTEADAQKIFYYEGDHSAIKSKTHQGKYESKWGAMPLMRHAPNYGPTLYSMQYRRYYKKDPIYISGPEKVCHEAGYSISKGIVSSWRVTGPFRITSSNNNYVTVECTNLQTAAYGRLTAVMQDTTVKVQRSLFSCQTAIAGPDIMGCQVRQFSLPYFPSGIGNITWSCSPGLQLVSGQGFSVANIKGNYANSSAMVSVSFTYNGDTLSLSKPVVVNPLNVSGLSLHIEETWWEGSTKCDLLSVRDGQGNWIMQDDVFFSWYTDYGEIYSCEGELLYPSPLADEEGIPEPAAHTLSLNGDPEPQLPPDDPPAIPIGDSRYVILRFTPDIWGTNAANVTCTYQTCTVPVVSSVLSVPGIYVPWGYYSIYPNPATSVLHFEIDQAKKAMAIQNGTPQQTSKTRNKCEVQLINVQTGALVFKQTVADFDSNFDMSISSVSNGLYVLRLVQNGTEIHTQNVLIKH